MPSDPKEFPSSDSNADRGDSTEDPTLISARDAARLLAEDRDYVRRDPDASQSVFLSLLQRTAELGLKPLAIWKRFVVGALFLKRQEDVRKKFRVQRLQNVLDQLAAKLQKENLAAKPGDPDLADRALRVILALPRPELELFLLVEWADYSLKDAFEAVYGDCSEASVRDGDRRLRRARRAVAEEIALWAPEERTEILSEASRRRIRDVLGDISGSWGEKNF